MGELGLLQFDGSECSSLRAPYNIYAYAGSSHLAIFVASPFSSAYLVMSLAFATNAATR